MHRSWCILRTIVGKKDRVGSGHGYIRYAISGTASDCLYTEIVFAAADIVVLDWNGDILCDLGQKNTT